MLVTWHVPFSTYEKLSCRVIAASCVCIDVFKQTVQVDSLKTSIGRLDWVLKLGTNHLFSRPAVLNAGPQPTKHLQEHETVEKRFVGDL